MLVYQMKVRQQQLAILPDRNRKTSVVIVYLCSRHRLGLSMCNCDKLVVTHRTSLVVLESRLNPTYNWDSGEVLLITS
jgi:hypothetical protein